MAARRLCFQQLEPILPLVWNPVGTNIQVSTVTSPERDQIDPVVAVSPGQFDDANTTYAVVWQFERLTNYSRTEILYRVFDGAGNPLTPERSIFSGVQGNVDFQDPRVAMADDGRFVVVWEETTSAGTQQAYYTLFDKNGNADATIQGVAVNGIGNNSNPDVYFAPDGKYFVVTWQTLVTNDNRDIFFRMVDLANLGLPTGAFAAGSTSNEFQPRIAGRKTGTTDINSDRFVLTWTQGTRTDTTRLDVGYNLFAIQSGTALYTTTQLVTTNDPSVDTTALNRDQYEASIAADASGNFVITYTELFSDETADNDVYFRRFNSAGVPVDVSRRPVDIARNINTNQSWVSMAADGSFVVTYEILGTNRVDIALAGFNSAASRVTSTDPVNSINNRSGAGVFQDNPTLALNALGNFVVVWGSNVDARGGSSSREPGFMDIMSQRYAISQPAALAAPQPASVTTASVAPITIEVMLDSAIPLNTQTIQQSSLEVTSSNKSLTASFVSMSSNATGTSVRAYYRLQPPGGAWDSTDNGKYVISLADNLVKDVAGNIVLAQTLTSLDVEIPATDTTAPTVSSFGNVQFGTDGTATFTITYNDDVALNAAALDNNDVRVTGPGGYTQLAALVSVNDLTAGPVRTATYRITAPAGTWNSKANGTYAVNILPDQVRDTSGNTVAAQVAGTFNVNLPPETPASPWRNPVLAQDVNNDGRVSSLDALYIINRLNQGLVGSLSAMGTQISGYVDVNGDGLLTPVDALQVINYLNQQLAQQRAATAAALPNVDIGPALSGATAQVLAENAPAAMAPNLDTSLAAHALAMEQEADLLRSGKKKL